jgi:TonB-dependent receptor
MAPKLLAGASIITISLTIASPAAAQQTASSGSGTQTASPSPLDQSAPPTTNQNEIVVTGLRASLRSARNIKKNSEQIVDSVTAQDIGALPDRSVSEALQRIPGVTLQRTNENRDPARLSAEGGGVFIRGLSWVRSELNGRDIFSARDGRALNFEDVSADLLAGIDVYKNPSADLIEGGIGGLVNLRTRKPLDQSGQLIAVSGDYNYADLRKKGFWSANALYSNRWGFGHGGEFGLLVSGSINNIGNRTDSIQTGAWATRTYDPDGIANSGDEFSGITPVSFGVRRVDWTQKRSTLAASMQLRPNPDLTFTVEGIYSKATPQDQELLIGDYESAIPALPTSQYDSSVQEPGTPSAGLLVSGQIPGRELDLDTRVSQRKYITEDFSGNVLWTPTPHWTFSADLQRVYSKADIVDFTVYTELSPLGTAVFNLAGDSPKLTYTFPTGGNEDPSNYWWAAAMDHFERDNGGEWASRADGEYKWLDNAFLKSFRFGARYTSKESIFRTTTYNWGLLSNEYWCGCGPIPINSNAAFAGQTVLYGFPGFLRGNAGNEPALWFPAPSMVGLGPNAAFEKVLQYARSQSWSWNPLPADAFATETPVSGGGFNDQTEKTYAGYGLLRFGMDGGPIGHFDGNIGMRVVRTENDATGTPLQIGTISGNTSYTACLAAAAAHMPAPYPSSVCDPLKAALQFLSSPIAANSVSPKNSYTDFLPSLNLRFFLRDSLFLRFAAARAIYRPQFYQLSSFASLNFNFDANGFPVNYGTSSQQPTFSGTGASPDLHSQKSDQADLSLEYYFGNLGQLSAAVFYKRISGYIVALPTAETLTNSAGQSLDFVLTRYVNSNKGTVKGAEFAYQQFYDFLPRPLDGIGLQANLTYVSSTGGANSPQGIFDNNQVTNAFAKLPLEGMSKWAFNLALLYEKYGFDARLAYNWRSHYLLTTSAANINQPVWAESYGQLDGSIFYNITKNVKLGVQGTNLLNSKTFLDVGYADFHPRYSWTVTDRRFAVIARAQF